jgi:hypothetical protein
MSVREPGPRMLDVLDRLVGILRSTGLDDEDAMLAAYSVFIVCLSQVVGNVVSGSDEQRALAVLPAESYPNLAAVALGMGARWSEENRFEYALESMLDGLDRRVNDRS